MEEQPQITAKRDKPAHFTTDALINHNQTEFRYTFFDTWMAQKTPQGKTQIMKDVVAEVVLTPTHAKAFLKALGDNISKYEKQFGAVKLPEKPPKTKVVGITETGEAYG